ncbi:hypothetical protein [Niabella hibiscisoli]|uniref:hypothetical protein n=1 Tax=Niabella hibiscisoli TaxID=1825928 RepID=UPI001F101C0F|nr:hypothetical protein [Niabella hibiscisoli]MCH5720793.1 hypothetical protein [Niabella hibiscisoli]
MVNKMVISLGIVIMTGISAQAQRPDMRAVFGDAEKQTRVMLAEVDKAKEGKPELVAPRTIEQGKLKLVKSGDWTSGFFPGVLWFLYEYSQKAEWKKKRNSILLILKKNNGTAAHMIWALKYTAVWAMASGLPVMLIIKTC